MKFGNRGLAAPLVVALVLAPALAERKDANRSSRPVASFGDFRAALVHVGHGRPVGGSTSIRWLGTGFLVDDDCTVVTAKHTVLGLARDDLLLRLQDPDDPAATITLSAYVLLDDPGSDLLFLRIAASSPGVPCSSERFGHFALAAELDTAALTGEDVLICGYPALEGERPSDVPILRKGSIASSELAWEGRPMLLLDLTGIPGFSGGPVILAGTGEAIGVVFGPGRTDRRYDLEWATPVTREDHRRARAAARRGGR